MIITQCGAEPIHKMAIGYMCPNHGVVCVISKPVGAK